MGAAVRSAASGRGRRSRRARFAPMSEINVTPMVDVMLVLLIVFMVAAPLLTVGVPVKLPETAARQEDRQIGIVVRVRIAHVAALEHHGAIQQLLSLLLLFRQ